MSPKSTRYLHKRLALEIYEKLEALSSGFWHKLDDKHRKMVTLVKRKQLKLITNGHRECYSDGGFLFFSSFCYSVDAADSPSVHLEWFDLIIRSWMRRVKRWNGPPWRRSESRRAMLRLELAVKLQPLLQLTVMRSLLSNLIHNFRCLNQLVILKTFRYPIDYVCFDHGIFLGFWVFLGFASASTVVKRWREASCSGFQVPRVKISRGHVNFRHHQRWVSFSHRLHVPGWSYRQLWRHMRVTGLQAYNKGPTYKAKLYPSLASMKPPTIRTNDWNVRNVMRMIRVALPSCIRCRALVLKPSVWLRPRVIESSSNWMD